MFSPVELFVGMRYIYAPRGNHFIAFISFSAIVATALGVAVLLTILSIMNGFEGELRERILGMAAHLEIDLRSHGAADWQASENRITNTPGVAAVAPYIRRDVLIQHRGMVRAVEARAVDIDAELRVTTLGRHMLEGATAALKPGAFEVLIGRELAAELGLARGDALTLLAPRPLVTPAGLVPRMKRFTVAGVFEFGLQEHDGALVLLDRQDGARLFRVADGVDGLRVRLHDAARAPLLKRSLAADLGVEIRDWTDTHRNLFRALKTEKIVMFVILALAIAIAAFNVISILVVAVTEKRSDIAMLGALGLAPPALMRIFLFQGGITGVVGVVAGLLLGFLLAANVDGIVAFIEVTLGFKILSPDIYYISRVPSEPRLHDFVITAIFASALALLAPLYPAWLASRTTPAEGLRHE